MAVAFSGSESVGTTEHSLTTDTGGPDVETGDGWYWATLTGALSAGDVYQFSVYEKVLSGGTQRLVYRCYFASGSENRRRICPALMLMHGWDMTLKKISGTDRTITWDIHKAGNVAEHATMTETVSTTEWSIPRDAAADSTLQSGDVIAQLWLDVSALQAGDDFMLTIYEDSAVLFRFRLAGAYADPIIVLPPIELTDDWDMTLDKQAGTDRSITASIRKAA
jgi:hypothetical protein